MAASKFRWLDPNALAVQGDRIARLAAATIEAHASAVAPVDTGTLARSITSRLDYRTRTRVRYIVGTNVFYAPFVEFGTRRMAAQPFLGPALEKARRRFG